MSDIVISASTVQVDLHKILEIADFAKPPLLGELLPLELSAPVKNAYLNLLLQKFQQLLSGGFQEEVEEVDFIFVEYFNGSVSQYIPAGHNRTK